MGINLIHFTDVHHVFKWHTGFHHLTLPPVCILLADRVLRNFQFYKLMRPSWMHHYFSVALHFSKCNGLQGIAPVICALSTGQSFTGCVSNWSLVQWCTQQTPVQQTGSLNKSVIYWNLGDWSVTCHISNILYIFKNKSLKIINCAPKVQGQ